MESGTRSSIRSPEKRKQSSSCLARPKFFGGSRGSGSTRVAVADDDGNDGQHQCHAHTRASGIDRGRYWGRYRVQGAESLETSLINKLEAVEDRPEDMVTRPPIVTFLGHVDHGKTSLLDYLIGTKIVTAKLEVSLSISEPIK